LRTSLLELLLQLLEFGAIQRRRNLLYVSLRALNLQPDELALIPFPFA